MDKVEIASPKYSRNPVFGYVVVGNRQDSALYVKLKQEACERVGIDVKPCHLPELTREETLTDTLQEMRNDPKVNGILL